MALLRKLFYRKPPDGLLEICERVYVFDCCFTTDVWEEENYKGYAGGVISQLRDHYPDASILVFNFREGVSQSLMANILSEYDLTIMDYPRHYEGCPLLSMEVMHHFLRSSESWLSLGQQNVLLMHCERGGWPVLAFMLAALLIYRKHYTGEQKTLDMIYKQAPRELLYLLQPLNPIPSQLRYLQYVARRNVNMQWPPLDRALTLDCIIIRAIPNFDGEGGCRPIFRIYGQDPFLVSDRAPKILFSTPKRNKVVRHYKQAECELVKIDINCHIQGDVVLECICLHDDLEREQMMFRTMFNTAFIRSNILILNRDELDTLWDAKDQFPKDFRAEVLFSEMDTAASVLPVDLSCFEEKDGLPVEAFAKVQEIFSSVDWISPNAGAARNVLQQITTSGLIQENLESVPPLPTDTSLLLDQVNLETPGERKGPAPVDNDAKGSSPFILEQQSMSSIKSSSKVQQSDQQKAEAQFVGTKSEMKVSKLQPSIPLSKPSPADLSTESSASSVSSQPSLYILPTSEHPPLVKKLDPHVQEYGKLNDLPALPEIRTPPFKTSIPTSPASSSIPGKDQGIGIGLVLSPTPVTPAPLTPPMKDKLVTGTVPYASPATPPKTQGPPIASLKDEKPTSSQPVPYASPATPPKTQGPPIASLKDEKLTSSQPVPYASPATPPKTQGPPIASLKDEKPTSSQPVPYASPATPPKTQGPPIASLKDEKLTSSQPVPYASPATPPKTQGPPIASLKDEKPTLSQPDTYLLPLAAQKPDHKGEPASSPHLTGLSLSPSPLVPSPHTPPVKDKLVTGTIPSASQATPPRTQCSPIVSLKDDRPAMSQSDAPLLPRTLQQPAYEGESTSPPRTAQQLGDEAAKKEPTRPLHPSKSCPPSLAPPNSSSPSAAIPFIKPIEQQFNAGSVGGSPQSPAPPTPPLKEHSVFRGVPSLPPPPLPPPPPRDSYPLSTPPVLSKNSVCTSEPLGPVPTLKESSAFRDKEPPPPPLPPPLPVQSMKENSSFNGGPAPPPPPPLPASQASKPANVSVMPPPPPPPALGSRQSVPSAPPPPALGSRQTVPSAPPPPVPSLKPDLKAGSGMIQSQSSKKLKPLHWLKISRAVSGSLWAEAQKCSDAPKAPEIDISELESLFSAAVPTSGQGSSGGKRNSGTSMGQKLEKVQLVDHRRAYNCEIMLSKVKIPLHEMLSSVLALEDSALDVDQVENLIKFCPTKEEMETLKGYKGEKEKLGRCEQFMLELMQVPRTESKLRVFSFKIQFESQVSELRKSLNIIKGSSKLKRIMQTILSLGNALNQGTARGSAVGFRLDSLLKLTETRARNNKMTLMHYLCKVDKKELVSEVRWINQGLSLTWVSESVLADKLPELLDFSNDLSSLEPCAKIQLKFLAEEMQAISKGLEKVVQELSMSENDGAVSENFRKALKEFLCYAEGEVRSLAQLYSGVVGLVPNKIFHGHLESYDIEMLLTGRNVDTLILYFGEDPARCPFEQVITTLLNFRRMFNQALEENRKQVEFERKKAEKEAMEKQKMSHSEKT
uniref:Formin-like protein n=1 Tax=Solanum lycopersicum TaxID=4081 RepID=A0A3Q7H6A2_SOLLC